MIEPVFTAASIFLYSAISNDLSKPTKDSFIWGTLDELRPEIMGTFVERGYDIVKQKLKLKERFPRFFRDNKETIYKSVRRSQLQAIKDVCNAYRDEIKGTNSESHNLAYIKTVEDYLKLEEAKLTRGDFVDVNFDENEVKRIISEGRNPENIQIDASNALAQELPQSDTLPTRFREMLQIGWQKDGVNHSLFERFEVHFNTELANPAVANPLFKKALVGIQFSLDDLTAGQANQTDEIRRIAEILNKRADELERLGYRILYKDGECIGIEITDKIISAIKESEKVVVDEMKGVEFRLTTELKKIDSKLEVVNNEKKAVITEISLQQYHLEQLAKQDIGVVVRKFSYILPINFLNREKERASLKTFVFDEERSIIAVKGGGGFGKTSLVDNFLKNNITNQNKIVALDKVNEIVIFNGQGGEIKFEQLFEQSASLLKRSGRDDSKLREIFQTDIDDDKRISILFEEIACLGNVWFIFDNCESVLDNNNRFQDVRLQQFINAVCRVGNGFRLFLTTREIPRFENNHLVSLVDMKGALPPDDAVSYLKSFGENWRVGDREDEYLAELAKKLGYIPKALYSFYEFFNQSRERPLVLSKVLENEPLFADFERHDFEKGYGKLIAEQFKVVGELEKLAWKVLSVFQTTVSSEAIKYMLSEYEIEDIWAILQGSGWVIFETRELDGELYYFYVLEEVAKTTIYKNLLSEEERKYFNLKAAAFYRSVHKPVKQCYTLEDFDTYFKEIEHCFQAGFYEQIVNVINRIMPMTMPLGMMNETLTRSKRIENLLEPKSRAKANNHINIGLSLYSLGKLNEAIIEYEKAIQILKDLVESGRTELANDLAKAYMNKGVSLASLGKLNEAIIEYDKAIQIRKDLVESGRTELANALASAYLNKGVSLASLGKLNEAIIEYDKAIQIRKDLVESGRTELANDLAMAYLNKGNVLFQQNEFAEGVEMFSGAINLWENELHQGFVHNLPNLVKALRIRVQSLIKLEDWAEIAADAIKSLALTMNFLQDENFSDHFKQQIGGEFGRMFYQIKQLSKDNQEKIFAEANKLGEMEGEKIPFGDILRQYIEQLGEE